MTAFFFYLFKVIVCSALFAAVYWCFMRNERIHQWNRFYLLVSVVLSLLIPALTIPVPASLPVIPALSETISYSVVHPGEVTEVPASEKTSLISWEWMVLTVYLSVVCFLLAIKIIFYYPLKEELL